MTFVIGARFFINFLTSVLALSAGTACSFVSRFWGNLSWGLLIALLWEYAYRLRHAARPYTKQGFSRRTFWFTVQWVLAYLVPAINHTADLIFTRYDGFADADFSATSLPGHESIYALVHWACLIHAVRGVSLSYSSSPNYCSSSLPSLVGYDKKPWPESRLGL